MSARKQINTQKNADRTTLMSDYGKLPGYNVDEYADRLTGDGSLIASLSTRHRPSDRVSANTIHEYRDSLCN
jgi:hypothetical protein